MYYICLNKIIRSKLKMNCSKCPELEVMVEAALAVCTFLKRQAYEYLETMDEPGSSMGIIDLSNDIYVNELAANQGRPQNPDAELIHLPESRPWQSNLEHDLRVNQLAAEQGWTPHPDSEFIDAKNEALSHSRPHVVQFADGRMRQSRSRYEYRTWP